MKCSFFHPVASHSPWVVRNLRSTASVRLEFHSLLWVGKPDSGLLMDHLGNPTLQVVTDPHPTKTFLMWALGPVSSSLAKAREGGVVMSQAAWPLPGLWSIPHHVLAPSPTLDRWCFATSIGDKRISLLFYPSLRGEPMYLSLRCKVPSLRSCSSCLWQPSSSLYLWSMLGRSLLPLSQR